MGAAAPKDLESRMAEELQRLTAEFRALPPEAVGRSVTEARSRLSGARIDAYLPIFVGRRARAILRGERPDRPSSAA